MTAVCSPAPGGVRLSVRVTPGAGRNAIGGTAADADGKKFLRVMVTAAPENGKANMAVIKLLAKSWKLPKSAFAVTSGATGRRKTIEISGDPQVIGGVIEAATEQDGHE